MVRDYYSHADPCRETVPRNNQHRYPQTHTASREPSNFVRQSHPGRVRHYYSRRYKPSRATEDSYEHHVYGPSVYDSDRCPIGSLCTFDRPSSFRREFKRRGSKPREAYSQQTRRSQNGLPERYVWNREYLNGNLLQHGSLGSSNKQFRSHSKRSSSNIRRIKSCSRSNSGYDEYPRYWASRDERITPDCMNPSHNFQVSQKPHYRRRFPNRTASSINSGYDECPRSRASLDKMISSTVQVQPSKSTDSKTYYKPPRKSRRRKAVNMKKHTPRRDQIAEDSDSLTDFSEPVHIKWDGGIGKECVHIEQICPVCEKDLSYMSSIDSYYEDDAEPPKLPEVAVLPCGHAFHTECLMQFTEEGQSREPPCFLCNSYLD
ncbi:hypothetical protein ACET3Z_014607 [Daucus carota]